MDALPVRAAAAAVLSINGESAVKPVTPVVSVIVPVLNEESHISSTLEPLQPHRDAIEIILVDGGSTDRTLQAAARLADQTLLAEAGRARQMNAGAAAAMGEVLLFLHADTLLPADFFTRLMKFRQSKRCWGRFDVRIAGRKRMFSVISSMMNWRSRVTGIATGDQGIFVRRSVFNQLEGYPDQPLMEDIALSRSLKSFGKPFCIRSPVLTSGRRWEKHGVWRTIVLMWSLRWRYFFGASAQELHHRYYRQ